MYSGKIAVPPGGGGIKQNFKKPEGSIFIKLRCFVEFHNIDVFTSIILSIVNNPANLSFTDSLSEARMVPCCSTFAVRNCNGKGVSDDVHYYTCGRPTYMHDLALICDSRSPPDFDVFPVAL
jgi:hypothetical protein